MKAFYYRMNGCNALSESITLHEIVSVQYKTQQNDEKKEKNNARLRTQSLLCIMSLPKQ